MKKPLHAPRQASAEAVLEFSVATIELYFRIEAITRAVGGFTEAGGEFGVMKSLGASARGVMGIFLSYGHDANEDLVRRIKADL